MPRYATFAQTARPRTPDLDAQDETDGSPALLHRLLEKLQRTPDFPALQASISGLQRLMRQGAARLQSLAEVVRADPAITHRLLRLSNTAHYRAAGGSHASVERAIALMGLDALQRTAISARLLDKLPRDARGLLLREDYLRALLAARLAQLLCTEPRELEPAYITALYQNLGRLVVAAHLPDEALKVRAEVPASQWPRVAPEQAESRRLLGVSYGQLGAQLARRWGWPDALRQAMRHDDWPLHRSPLPAERLRWLGRLANDLADLLLYQPPVSWPGACSRLVAQAGAATGCGGAELQHALAAARAELADLAQTVGLPVSQLQDWLRSDAVHGAPEATAPETAVDMAAPVRPAPAEPAPAPDAVATAASPAPTPPTAVARADLATAPRPRRAAAVATGYLAEQAQALADALLADDAATVVPRRALSVLCRGLGARRAVLHLAAPGQQQFRPVRAVGTPPGRPGAAQPWQVDPVAGRDLFALACARGNDVLVDDARVPQVARHLPEAFVQGLNARCFMVLPIAARGRRLGMIYLDRDDDQPFVLDDEALRLVRSVRNHAALALV